MKMLIRFKRILKKVKNCYFLTYSNIMLDWDVPKKSLTWFSAYLQTTKSCKMQISSLKINVKCSFENIEIVIKFISIAVVPIFLHCSCILSFKIELLIMIGIYVCLKQVQNHVGVKTEWHVPKYCLFQWRWNGPLRARRGIRVRSGSVLFFHVHHWNKFHR